MRLAIALALLLARVAFGQLTLESPFYPAGLLKAPPAAGGGGGGIPVALSWTNGADGSAKEYRFTNTLSAGDSLTGSMGWEDANSTWTIHSDSAGNTWTFGLKTNSLNQWAQEFRCINAASGGSPVITVFTNGSAANTLFIKGGMIRWLNIAAYDVGNSGTNFQSFTTPDYCASSNFTTTATAGLWYFAHNYNGRTATAPGTGWTLGRNVGGYSLQYRTNVSIGTYQGTVTNSGSGTSVGLAGAGR